jgi:glutamate 5-kinase
MGASAAQILLTHADFEHRRRYLNLRNTLAALHDARALPVINENDVVSVDEIRFGDNDILAALVANAVDAELTVLFSDVSGIFDGERRLDVVEDPAQAGGAVRKGHQGYGTGGMASKVEAARIVTASGGALVVAHGKQDSLDDILAGKPVGTVFVPSKSRMEHRKRWIAFSVKEAGSLQVDPGAEAAILKRGKSLLAAGVVGCEGDFEAGDAVLVKSNGRSIAKGLTNYSAGELRKIQGKKTDEIEKILGYKFYDEVIHRDNLVALEKAS